MHFFKRLTPFIIAGIMLAVMAFGMILLAYLFLIGTVIGMILYAFNWIRERYFTPRKKQPRQPSGRVIDSDEWRKL